MGMIWLWAATQARSKTRAFRLRRLRKKPAIGLLGHFHAADRPAINPS